MICTPRSEEDKELRIKYEKMEFAKPVLLRHIMGDQDYDAYVPEMVAWDHSIGVTDAVLVLDGPVVGKYQGTVIF